MPASGPDDLITFIGADNSQLLRSVAQSTAALRRFSAAGIASIDALSMRMGVLGAGMRANVTIPVLGAAAAVGVFGGKFEKSMNTVQAVSGVTAQEFKSLEIQARDLGETTQFSAGQAADAMAILSKSGQDANQILGSTPRVLELAAAAGMDLEQSAEIVSSTMAGFRFEVEELANVNDVLVKTFISSKTNLQNLGQALKFAGPAAKAAGLSFESTVATLGFLANAGFEAEMAGTGLRGSIMKLLNPSKEAKEILDKYRITIEDTEGKLLSMSQIMAQFAIAQRKVANETEFAQAAFKIFAQRAGPAFLSVLAQGSEELAKFEKGLENVEQGLAKRIADVQMRGLIGSFREFKSAAEGLIISVGKAGLLKDMTALFKVFAEGLRTLSRMEPALLAQSTKWALIAAAAGPVLLLGSKLGLMFAGLVKTLGFVGLALVKLVASIKVLGTAAVLSPLAVLGAAIFSVLDSLGVIDRAVVATRFVFNMAWASVAKNYGNFVNFFKGKTDELSGFTKDSVEFMAKTWLSLKIVFKGLELSLLELLSTMNKAESTTLKFIANQVDNLGKNLVTFELGDKMRQFAAGMHIAAASVESDASKAAEALDALKRENSYAVLGMLMDWGNAPEVLRSDVEEFKAVFTEIMTAGGEIVAAHTPQFILQFREMMAQIRAEMSGEGLGEDGGGLIEQLDALGPMGAGDSGDVGAEGTGGEEGGIAGGISVWSENLLAVMENTKIMAVEIMSSMWVDIRSTFSDAFKDLVRGQKNFGTMMLNLADSISTKLIDMFIQDAMEFVAIAYSKGMATAISSAPSPYMIPVYIGAFVAAWASGMGGTELGSDQGGGGGGGGAPATPSAVATQFEEPDLPEADDEEREITLNFPELEGAVAKLVVKATRNGLGDGFGKLALVTS